MSRKEQLIIAVRLLGALAVAVALFFFATALTQAATKKVSHAAIDHFGRAFADAAAHMEDGSRLEMNGGWVEFNVGMSNESVESEVERLSKTCKRGKAIEESNEDSGFVLCHDPIEGISDVLDLDPSSLGLHSFAYVDKAEGKTRYVHLSSDEKLTLGQLLPADGDAPGFDVVNVPRIDGLERWMSFRDSSGGYQAAFYGGGPASLDETLKWYTQQMASAGWIVELKQDEESEHPYLIALRSSNVVIVLVDDDCDGTCVSIISATGTGN